MKTDVIKRKVKNALPWKIRLKMGLFLANYPQFAFRFLKQTSSVEKYKSIFYGVLERLGNNDLRGMSICEMGIGEFFSHAAFAYQLGAEKITLLEICDFADINRNVSERELSIDNKYQKYKTLPGFDSTTKYKDYLKLINTDYFYDGLQGYKRVKTESVDILFSHTVLQHIRKKEFKQTMEETYRMLKANGLAFHKVDLRDCIGGKKNNLRFSVEEWESDKFYKMDNYTNRLSCSEICNVLSDIGFVIKKVERQYFDAPPIERTEMDESFREMSGEDIMTKGFYIWLTK